MLRPAPSSAADNVFGGDRMTPSGSRSESRRILRQSTAGHTSPTEMGHFGQSIVDRVTASTASQHRPRHSIDRVTASTPSQRRPPHGFDRVTAWPSPRRRRSAVGDLTGATHVGLPLRPHGAVPAPPGNGVHSRCTGRAWRAHTPGHQSDPVTTTSIRCLTPTVGALAPEPAVPGRGLR